MRRTVWTVLATLLAAVPAAAQRGGDIDIDAFRPAIDSRGYVTVNASQVLKKWDLSFGLITDWGFKVLKLEGGPVTAPGYDPGNTQYNVTHVISPNLQAAFGLFGIAEIGVTVPFHIVLGDADPDFVGVADDPRDNDK